MRLFLSHTMISLGKGNSVSLVLQGYTSFEKNLRASLRSGSIFSKNLAGQGHGIVVCPMKSCWFQKIIFIKT
jgi:hypothetical protein